MAEGGEPREVKRPHLQRRPVLAREASPQGQEAVDDEEGQRGDDDAGDAAHRQRLHHAHAGQPLLRVLRASCFQPEQEAGGDHHAARQTGEEVQPAQAPMIELDEMQAGDKALHRHHRCGLEAREHRAGLRVEGHPVQVHGDVLRVGASHLDIGVGVARVPHAHEVGLAARPLALGLDHHGVQRDQRAGGVELRALVKAVGLPAELVLRFLAKAVGAHVRLREVDADEDDQTRQRDHEVKGQRQHAGQVVQVQTGALQLLLRPEQKEVDEDFLVDHHAGDEQRERRHAGQAHDPVA